MATMPIYDLGDGVNLRQYVTDRDGQPTNATVALSMTKPDATSVAVTVTNPATGQYDAATFTPTTSGEYRYKWTINGAVTDVRYGTFTVADPGPACYSDISLVKGQLGKVTSDDRDELISASILAASRMIDSECGFWPGAFRADAAVSVRTFDLADRTYSPTTARGFAQTWGRVSVRIDPVATFAGLVVATGTSLTGTYVPLSVGFSFGPQNALALNRPLRYVTMARATVAAVDSLQVTARWGWPTIPPEIELATRMLAARLYRRKDSPQGVITSADWGAVRVSRTDPDVHALIFPYMTPGFA